MEKSVDIALIQPTGWAVENPPLGLGSLKGYFSHQNITTNCFDLKHLYSILNS